MEELNKKLAEWAADEIEHFNNDQHRHYRFGKDWYQSSLAREPNFTQSLDAIFKWLVPKANLFRIIFTDPSGNNQLPRCDIRPLDKDDICGFGETFALALCCAFGKLIDGEKDVERPSS